uniref:Uncharacterized protein n=1 Tax=Schistosoma mansoni TaxID=6183 RepID=A0A5K4EZP4_SCHMA
MKASLSFHIIENFMYNIQLSVSTDVALHVESPLNILNDEGHISNYYGSPLFSVSYTLTKCDRTMDGMEVTIFISTGSCDIECC